MNDNRYTTFATASVALLFAFWMPQSLGADKDDSPWKAKLKPTILSGSDDDTYAPGIRYELSYEGDLDGNDDWEKVFVNYGFDSKGAFATDSDANSEGIFAELHAGLMLNTSKIGETGEWPTVAPRPDEEGDVAGMKEQVSRPFIHLSAVSRFETDQDFDNYQLASGPRLGVVHARHDDLSWWVAVPSLQLDYLRIDLLESEQFTSLGLPEDGYWRFSALGDWRFEVGNWWAPESSNWHGLGLHTRLAYYRGVDLPTAAVASGLEDSWYYAGGAHYRFKEGKKIWKGVNLNFAYLTVSHGATPPSTNNQTGIQLGLVLSWGTDDPPNWGSRVASDD